jgi:hypothetical protein
MNQETKSDGNKSSIRTEPLLRLRETKARRRIVLRARASGHGNTRNKYVASYTTLKRQK